MSKTCLFCDKLINSERPMYTRLKYCNRICSSKYATKKFLELNKRKYTVSPNTQGAISELQVAIDLLQKGYEVFRALSPACSCDLAILKNKKLLRIEVKTAFRSPTGKIVCSKLRNEKYDILVKVLHDKLVYEPKL